MTIVEPAVAPTEQVTAGLVPRPLLDALDALGMAVIATGDAPVGSHVILPYEVVRALLTEAHSVAVTRCVTEADLKVVRDALRPYKQAAWRKALPAGLDAPETR